MNSLSTNDPLIWLSDIFMNVKSILKVIESLASIAYDCQTKYFLQSQKA